MQHQTRKFAEFLAERWIWPHACGMEPTRGEALKARMDAIGISKREFAERAEIDRGTLDRVLADDPSVTTRTLGKVEQQLAALEDEMGMAESGHLVVSSVTVGDAVVTVRGSAADVAEAVRKILD